MHSTPIAKPSDDPHDILVVAPDVARVAPVEDELSSLLHEAAARYGHGFSQNRAAADVSVAARRCRRSTPHFARLRSTIIPSRTSVGRW